MEPRRLHLAAIQMVSVNGRVTENLTRAEHWAKLAAERRAEVVLLPELFSTGFEINARAWNAAEPQGGPTESWLVATARRHDYFIGGSYLERRGDDFFNTFALAGPTGIVGRVRKRHPCSVEAYIFKGGDDPHVIETPLGRFGVAICYDSSLREVWDRILASSPDLLLLPMSAPTLALGHQRSSFPGFTHIADSDGQEVARVADGEGVAVATVCLDSSLKRESLPPERERSWPWIAEVPAEYRFFAVFEALGRRWYERARSEAR